MMWQKIQQELDERGWSKQYLSEKSQIPISTLNKYKFLGVDPTFTKICKIADALEIQIDDLREDKWKG